MARALQIERWSTIARRCVAMLVTVAPALAHAQSGQTDWTGGPGEAGPVMEWTDRFQAANDIAWRSIADQIALASTPLGTPQMHIVAANAEHPASVAVGDIDGDGVNDIVSPDYVTDIINDLGAIYWWRLNEQGDWVLNFVDDEFYGGKFVDTADVDLDGDLDVIVAASAGPDPNSPGGLPRNGRFAWFENLAGDGSTWTQHLVGEMFWGAQYIDAGDLDGDGDIDLAGASELTDGVFEQDADIAWFENLDGDGDSWALHALENNAGHGWEVHIADIDGDGALDVVSCEDGRVAWFDNANGDGSLWLKRTVSASLQSATFADVGDIDYDGDLDIIGGSYQTMQIGWWDNTAGTGSVWFPRYVVDASNSTAIDLGDADGDGDLDALIAKQTGGSSGGVWWIENVDGTGIIWDPRLVDLGFQSQVWTTLADVNADGRLDAMCSDEDFAGNDTRQLTWFDLTQFVSNGDLISSILDAGDNPRWGPITWDAGVPAATALNVEVRASNDPFNLGVFVPVVHPGQALTDLIDAGARFLQYRLLLDTVDADASPVVHELSVTMQALGDSDGDGDVDLLDFVIFGDCLFGPDVPPAPPPPLTTEHCLNVFDSDLDEDVDLRDFATFAGVFTGE
ncbi:MAG: FG-GAP repeat domain-containing protein [Planctomycetota bacterium]